MLGAVDLDVAARVLVEEDLVARLDLQLAERAVLLELAAAHRDDESLLGLFLGAVGDEQPARRLALLLDALDEDPVVKWPYLHFSSPPSISKKRAALRPPRSSSCRRPSWAGGPASRPWSPWPGQPTRSCPPSWSHRLHPRPRSRRSSRSSCWSKGRCTNRPP